MNCYDNKSRQDQESSGIKSSGLKGLLTGPRRLWLIAAVVVAGSLAMGWEQLAILGIAPILVSLLPCLVMCGLGLCMMKCKDKKEKTTDSTVEEANIQASVEDSRPATKETA